MIEQLKSEYPLQVICDVIGYSQSRYYYRSDSAKQKQEEDLKKAIIDVAGRYPPYGHRRITQPTIAAREMDGSSQTYQPINERIRTTGQATTTPETNDE